MDNLRLILQNSAQLVFQEIRFEMKMKVLRMNIESSNTVFVNTSTFFALIQKHISENGPLFSIETESLNKYQRD